jgi:anti-sigma B factor antagonist
MDLEVLTSEQGGWSVLSLRGEIDVYTAPRLRQTLIEVVEGGAANVLVDMTEVDFLDSSGLGVLVGGLKRVKARDGSLEIVATEEKILKIFEITGLSKVFPMHTSVDAALSA